MQLDSSSESFRGFPLCLIDHGFLLCYRLKKEAEHEIKTHAKGVNIF